MSGAFKFWDALGVRVIATEGKGKERRCRGAAFWLQWLWNGLWWNDVQRAPTLRRKPFQEQGVVDFNASRPGCVLRMEQSNLRNRLIVQECWAETGGSQASGLLLWNYQRVLSTFPFLGRTMGFYLFAWPQKHQDTIALVVFFAWKNKSVLVCVRLMGSPAHASGYGKVWVENKRFTNDSRSRCNDVFSAPTEKGGSRPMKYTPLPSLCALLGAGRPGCLCLECFLSWSSVGVPREDSGLYLVSNSDCKGSLHLMGVLISWLFF